MLGISETPTLMNTRGNKVVLSEVHYACLAPLSRPVVNHIRTEITRPRKRKLKLDGLPPFYESRVRAYSMLSTAVARGDLSTTWLCKALTELSPGSTSVQRSTLLDWRKAGLLRYDEEDHPAFHNAGELLVARQCLPMLRGWLPDNKSEDEPSYFAWILFSPESTPQMAAMPLPEVQPGEPRMVYLLPEEAAADPTVETSEILLPHLVDTPALLYTGWHGAERDGMLKVEAGSIRFLSSGAMTGEQLLPWARYATDLAARKGQFHLQAGNIIGLENEPDIFSTTCELVLKLIARELLEVQKHVTLWSSSY